VIFIEIKYATVGMRNFKASCIPQRNNTEFCIILQKASFALLSGVVDGTIYNIYTMELMSSV
jgi:hypothetical protein